MAKRSLPAISVGGATVVPTSAATHALDKAVRTGRAFQMPSGLGAGVRAISSTDDAPYGVGDPPQDIRSPGGDAVSQMLHPEAFTVFEREYRALPEEGMFSPLVGGLRPSFEFTLGSFTVPDGQSLWVLDYQFGVLLLDGVNPGDFREAEDGRFSGVMGFDLTVNERRRADIQYQLDPVPIQVNRSQFDPNPAITARARPSDFNTAAAESFASTSTAGLSILPTRRAIQGPNRGNPWTWIVNEGQRIALKCVIWRPILSPIAAIFGRIGGYKLHVNLSSALVNRTRPK